jgi:hypothetical protein
MIFIPIKTKKDTMKLFNLFQKKETFGLRIGLEKAMQEGIITRQEYLKIIADRATEDLRKFLDAQKQKK